MVTFIEKNLYATGRDEMWQFWRDRIKGLKLRRIDTRGPRVLRQGAKVDVKDFSGFFYLLGKF